MSRLISRLRHRRFGLIVTTSCVDLQACREIKEDQHPIVIIAARDIAELLRRNGRGSVDAIQAGFMKSFRQPLSPDLHRLAPVPARP